MVLRVFFVVLTFSGVLAVFPGVFGVLAVFPGASGVPWVPGSRPLGSLRPRVSFQRGRVGRWSTLEVLEGAGPPGSQSSRQGSLANTPPVAACGQRQGSSDGQAFQRRTANVERPALEPSAALEGVVLEGVLSDDVLEPHLVLGTAAPCWKGPGGSVWAESLLEDGLDGCWTQTQVRVG